VIAEDGETHQAQRAYWSDHAVITREAQNQQRAEVFVSLDHGTLSVNFGMKARREIFPWRIGNKQYLVQVDPYYIRARKVWEVTDPVAELVRTATKLRTGYDAIWTALAEQLCSSWLDNESSYDGRNLLHCDNPDSSAGEMGQRAVSALQPWFLDLELNQTCNLKCTFCYVHALPRVMGRSEVLHKGISRAAETNTLFLNITGGEPTLCKELVDLILDGIQRGLAVMVRTNLLVLPKDIDRLAGEGRVVFITSFHHSTAEVFDNFVGKRGGKSAIVANIIRLRRLGLRVRAHVVATIGNIDSLPEMVEQFGAIGIPFTLTDDIMPIAARRASEAASSLRFKVLAKQSQRLLYAGMVDRQRNRCTAAQSKLWLAANGEVFPCELFRERAIGNYVDHSLRQILDSPENERWRSEFIYSSEPADCISCNSRAQCPRCPAMVYMQRGTTHEKHQLTCDATRSIYRC
jgi:radical SAM protein with 4Fe4S-binding SPASM domain